MKIKTKYQEKENGIHWLIDAIHSTKIKPLCSYVMSYYKNSVFTLTFHLYILNQNSIHRETHEVIHPNKDFIIEPQKIKKSPRDISRKIYVITYILERGEESVFSSKFGFWEFFVGLRFERDDVLKRGACGQHLQVENT